MLVGRDDEVRAIAAAVDERRAVVLTGPAGIGKTTVARQAVADAVSRSWREAGALATLAWSPLLVFRRLLRTDVPDDPERVAAQVLRSAIQAVVLDDLQWADDASLQVISHLVGRIAIVATVRTGEERSEVVTDSLALVGATTMTIGPLSEVHAARLVQRHHPQLAADRRESVLRQSAGNPLLLVELPVDEARSPTLVSALLARLDALGPDARQAMARLAVLGRPADAALLGSGAGDLVSAGLAHRYGLGGNGDDEIEVGHVLLAEVLVDLLGSEADDLRRELAPMVPAPEAAHLLAAAGDRDQARATARRAAAETTDIRDRAELLELAVSCAPAGDLDADNRLTAGRLLLDTSQPDRAETLCTVAGIDELPAVVRGALRGVLASAAWMRGDVARSRALAADGIGDLRGTGTAEEVWALAASTIFDTRIALDGRPSLPRAREAVALAEMVGAHQSFARTRLASVLLTAGEPGWVELYEAVIDDAELAGDDRVRRSTLNSLVLGQWVAGDPQEAHRLAWTDVQRGPDHEHDNLWLSHHAYSAVIGLLVGVDRNLLVGRHGDVLTEQPMFHTRPFLEAAVSLALADLGRLTEGSRRARDADALKAADPRSRSVGLWALADTSWASGRLDDARDAAAEAARLPGQGYPSTVHARLVGAHADREQGTMQALDGPEPVALLPAWRGAPVEWSALARAVERDHDGAAERFDEAADGWSGNDARSEARCRWAAADEARLAGRDDAVERLVDVVDRAERQGLAPVAARARRSLRRAGITSRVSSSAGEAGLTSREEEVLRLVGAGLSSRDIAATFGLKTSTVDSFVRSATLKLGAPTRLAAAARLSDESTTSG